MAKTTGKDVETSDKIRRQRDGENDGVGERQKNGKNERIETSGKATVKQQ